MDENNLKNNTICCFCGKIVEESEAMVLEIHTPLVIEKTQGLYSHKECLISRLHKGIPLHPALLDKKETNSTVGGG